MKNNTWVELICLQQLFEYSFVIPAFQRNYVWSEKTVEKVLDRIIKGYNAEKQELTFGMVTLFKTDSLDVTQMYVIDGQQRLITFKLLLHLLAKDTEENRIRLTFERDNCLKENDSRIAYIQKLNNDSVPHSVDTERFQNSYRTIQKTIQKNFPDYLETTEKTDDFLSYLFHHVKVLVHLTDTHPNAEFLNLNANKNRFSLADYAKTYMMIANPNQKDKISCTFKELSKAFYDEEKWNLLIKNYDEIPQEIQNEIGNGVENRLDILFHNEKQQDIQIVTENSVEDRHDTHFQSKDAVDKLTVLTAAEKELERLRFCLQMMNDMWAHQYNKNIAVWFASKHGLKWHIFKTMTDWYNRGKRESFYWFAMDTVLEEIVNVSAMNTFLHILTIEHSITTEEIEQISIDWDTKNAQFYGALPDLDVMTVQIQQEMERIGKETTHVRKK